MNTKFQTFLLILLSPLIALFQTTAPLNPKGELAFEDTITDQKLIENKLVLVGKKSVRILDLSTGKFAETYPLTFPQQSEDQQRQISPNGHHMLVFGNSNYDDKKNKERRPAAIWDLRTGKQIVALEKNTVRYAAWSRNGKILATSTDSWGLSAFDKGKTEISFWDGETFEYLSSIPLSQINWSYLSEDGNRFFFSTGSLTNFIIDRWVGLTGKSIIVWNPRAGTVEQTITVKDGDLERNIRGIEVSPDERFLTFVTQPQKGKESERRIAVWKMEKSHVDPTYEIAANPKINEWGVTFSADGKYFAYDAGKTLQIYETRTGQKKYELVKDDQPSHWLNDNEILLYDYSSKMVGREISSGRELFQQKMAYSVYSYYANSEDTIPTNEVQDYTRIVPHPSGKLLLTHSNQYLKVYDARTGALLQTLVEPKIDTSKPIDPKKGPRYINKDLVWKAGWSADGKAVYAIDHDRVKVFLWRME